MGFIVSLVVVVPDLGHHNAAGDVLALDGMVFVVTAPDGCDQVGSEAYEPDVFAFIGGAGFAGHGTVGQLGLGAGTPSD